MATTAPADGFVPVIRAPATRRRRGWDAIGGTTLSAAIVFLALWEAVVYVFEVPRYIVPAPSAVYRQFVRQFPLIWRYTLVTCTETGVGYVVALVIGVPLS